MKLKAVMLLLSTAIGSQAAGVVWQGGSGNWGDANWLSADAPAGRTTPAAINDRLEIHSGTVTVAGGLCASAPGSLRDNTLSVGGTAKLVINGALDFGAGKEGNAHAWSLSFVMKESAEVTASHLQLKVKKLERSELTFSGGTLVLTSNNPILGSSFPEQHVNIAAPAGRFSVVATAVPLPGKSLATKVGSDLFAIDGEKIIVAATGQDVTALNAELASTVVNGKFLRIEGGNDGPQTLEILSAGDAPARGVIPDVSPEKPVIPLKNKKKRRPEPQAVELDSPPESLGLIFS